MTDELKKLVDAARAIPMTAQEKEQQRRSFAYGNTKIENPRITRGMVDQQAELLKKADG